MQLALNQPSILQSHSRPFLIAPDIRGTVVDHTKRNVQRAQQRNCLFQLRSPVRLVPDDIGAKKGERRASNRCISSQPFFQIGGPDVLIQSRYPEWLDAADLDPG